MPRNDKVWENFGVYLDTRNSGCLLELQYDHAFEAHLVSTVNYDDSCICTAGDCRIRIPFEGEDEDDLFHFMIETVYLGE